jgi:hypothetical protein
MLMDVFVGHYNDGDIHNAIHTTARRYADTAAIYRDLCAYGWMAIAEEPTGQKLPEWYCGLARHVIRARWERYYRRVPHGIPVSSRYE